jgi:hypothetical protein
MADTGSGGGPAARGGMWGTRPGSSGPVCEHTGPGRHIGPCGDSGP